MIWVKNNLEYIFLILLIAGYPVISSFAIPFGVDDSRFFSVPYRILIFIISIVVIFRNFKKENLFNVSSISLLAFWIYYVIKTYFSLSNDYFEGAFLSVSYEIYYRIFLIILFPSLALLFINYHKINLKIIANYFFYILFAMLSVNLLYGFIMPHEDLSFRFIFSMYYISYGQLGATLSMMSFYFLLFKDKTIPLPFLISGFILGILTIVVGTARSPFLSLIIVYSYFLIVNRQLKPILYFILAFITFVIALYFYKELGYSGIKFADRTYNWFFNGDNSLRTPLYTRAIEIIKSHPIFGGRVLYENGSYPHDIFLEILMATGFFGFVLYFLKFLPVIKNLKYSFSAENNKIYILFFGFFLQYFVLTLTSFSIFSVPEFLYFSSIIIGVNLNKFHEKT